MLKETNFWNDNLQGKVGVLFFPKRTEKIKLHDNLFEKLKYYGNKAEVLKHMPVDPL